MSLHILLTRPAGDELLAAQSLRELGMQVSHVPALEIQPLEEDSRRQRLDEIFAALRPEIIICASRNAVIWGLPLLLEQQENSGNGATWFAIGQATAAALETFAVKAIAPAGSSRSETFLAMPQLERVAGKDILYVAGEEGRRTIEDELVARGGRLKRWDVYRRRPNPDVARALTKLPEIPDILTAMSGDSLLALDEAVAEMSTDQGTQWHQKRLLVPSERVAQLAASLGYVQVEIAEVTESIWPVDYLCKLADL